VNISVKKEIKQMTCIYDHLTLADQLTYLRSIDTTIDPDIMQLSNVYLSTRSVNPKSRMLDDSQDDRSILNQLDQLLNTILITLDPTVTKIFGNDYQNTQVAVSNMASLDEYRTIAKNHNLTIVDFENCLSVLKKAYNTQNILAVKTEQRLSEKSTNITVSYYNSISRKQLDRSLCNSEKIKKQYPVTLTAAEKKRYQDFKDRGIDIYNPFDRAFSTVCLPYTDPDKDFDTTLNYRLQNYFIEREECSQQGCYYTELATDGYVTCECTVNYVPNNNSTSGNIIGCISQVEVCYIS
jgi:hypothetical protein